MPWNTNIDDGSKFIEFTYSGVVTAQELHDAITATSPIIKTTGILRFLADCTQMIMGHSIVDLYYLIDLYEKLGLSRNMKEAILLPSPHASSEEVKFYETACYNKGYHVKIFEAREDALLWLLG